MFTLWYSLLLFNSILFTGVCLMPTIKQQFGRHRRLPQQNKGHTKKKKQTSNKKRDDETKKHPTASRLSSTQIKALNGMSRKTLVAIIVSIVSGLGVAKALHLHHYKKNPSTQPSTQPSSTQPSTQLPDDEKGYGPDIPYINPYKQLGIEEPGDNETEEFIDLMNEAFNTKDTYKKITQLCFCRQQGIMGKFEPPNQCRMFLNMIQRECCGKSNQSKCTVEKSYDQTEELKLNEAIFKTPKSNSYLVNFSKDNTSQNPSYFIQGFRKKGKD